MFARNLLRKSYFSMRLFASDADILKKFKGSQIIRTSTLELKANKLIDAIRTNNYELAKQLVIKESVDVNGHNRTENTPLTDAAARGDTKGVRFLITQLGANPSASCDCPNHKTALHYASENGHAETVQELLNCGANPNLLDSRKYTALDIAKTQLVREKLLIAKGNFGKEIEGNVSQMRLYFPKR